MEILICPAPLIMTLHIYMNIGHVSPSTLIHQLSVLPPINYFYGGYQYILKKKADFVSPRLVIVTLYQLMKYNVT